MASIGIDLGTTNCCMAYVKDDKPVIIPNYNGEYTTPSYIGFNHSEIIFGKTARSRKIYQEKNTIYDVKRFIGRTYDDPNVQKYIDTWAFNLINYQGKIKVSVRNDEVDKMYSPEMLSGLLLKHLKKQAEAYIGKPVQKAYITVPTYFNDAQRQATIDAGKIGGFEEVRLLNEPTAAAIAYSTDHCSDEERTIFVFDLGGGTFDVSLIKYKNRDIKVIAIDGDLDLGGRDITQNVVKEYAKVINDKHDFNVYEDRRKYIRFNVSCDDLKHQLSESVDATMHLYEFTPVDDELIIQRDEFEKINKEIFDKTLKIVDRCLKRSGLDVNSIDDVVVVGGSTRIKRITKLLGDYFNKPLKFTINADQAVAMGAAIAASKWDGNKSFTDVVFRDICPYSLGVEISGNEMSIIIPKYSTLPASGTKIYCNSKDGQTLIRVKIFSGEDKCTKYNKFLGELVITGFQPGPAKSIKLHETFTYDENGILSVEVEERTTGKKNLIITLDKGRLSQNDLQEQTETAEKEYREFEEISKFKEMRQKVVEICTQDIMMENAGPHCASTLTYVKALTYSKENFEQLTEKYNVLLKFYESLK